MADRRLRRWPNQRIPGIFAFEHGSEVETVGQHGRHVLAAVDREIDVTFQQGVFDLFDEETLSADLGQRHFLETIARCLDHHNLAGSPGRHADSLGDERGLEHGEMASSRAETQCAHWPGFFAVRGAPAVVNVPSSPGSSL